MEACISARNVKKVYKDLMALQGVDLDVYNGEILSILGPNGAGKTTLIKIFATILAKTEGKVEILGYDLDKGLNEIRRLFGYVGQDTDRSAYGRLTVLENLQFFGALRGFSAKQIKPQIEKLVHYFNFSEKIDAQFMQLSGGQKQTAVIMRALIHDPPLIFLDEPTKGLDPIVAKKTRSFLKQYVKDCGKSMLLTSHILSEVEEMASRVALIHKGKIKIVNTPALLKKDVGVTDFFEIQNEGLTPEVVKEISGLKQVISTVTFDPDWTAFGVNDFFDSAKTILDMLAGKNIKISFRHRPVTLEDAFLYHFGELGDRFTVN